MHRERIDLGRLRTATSSRWSRLDVVDVTGSTNADLLVADLSALSNTAAAPERSVLIAEHQRSGRGRLERSWVSPPRAGLTFSVLLHPAPPVRSWGWLPLLTGVALRDAVRASTGLESTLKWPNDLLALPAELKLAGILAQTSGSAVVVGIGLNVSTTAAELPVDTATSLVLCGAADIDRTVLLAAILEQLDTRFTAWSEHGGAADGALVAAYRSACGTLGRRVSVRMTNGQLVVGEARDVDADGRLLIDVDGRLRAVGAGDVQHLRPAG